MFQGKKCQTLGVEEVDGAASPGKSEAPAREDTPAGSWPADLRASTHDLGYVFPETNSP